jgi:hypothetical protein
MSPALCYCYFAMEETDSSENVSGSRFRRCLKTVGDVLYGLMLHELDLQNKKSKGNLQSLFMLVVFGDLVGLPVLPPYYSMRILPYIVPDVARWKRTVLRERDLTDLGTDL